MAHSSVHGRPRCCKRFLNGRAHVVRRCRLSGLLVRPVSGRWPVWRCADRVYIVAASLKLSSEHWSSRPRLGDRLPIPVLGPAHIPRRLPACCPCQAATGVLDRSCNIESRCAEAEGESAAPGKKIRYPRLCALARSLSCACRASTDRCLADSLRIPVRTLRTPAHEGVLAAVFDAERVHDGEWPGPDLVRAAWGSRNDRGKAAPDRWRRMIARPARRKCARGFPLVWCLTNTLTNLRVLLAVGCVALPRVVPATRAGLKPAPTSHRALPTTKMPSHLHNRICETPH